MFSKRYLNGALALALVVGTSCTPKVGEAPPDNNNQNKLEGTQCLSDLKPVVTKYVVGEATDSEVIQGWDCASLAIKNFKKYVYGRSEDRYTSLELVKFLEENFLAQTGPKISDELRFQFMKFKQLFVGGSTNDLTRAELDKLIGMFDGLKAITLRLNPYMRVISQKWSIADSRDAQGDVRFFEKASDEIQASAAELAQMVVVNNQTYQLDDFVNFMREYAEFYGENWEIAATIEKFMPVVKKVKRAIAGGNQESVAPGEWRSFVQLGVRGYIQYLRYFYFIKSASETGSGIRLGYLARSLEDLLGAFQDLLEVKPTDPKCGTQIGDHGKPVAVSCISKAEITDILTAFSDVWKEFRVSEKLIDESMKIKKVYFGGSTETMSSLDFERGKKKVASLKMVVEKFLPYYSIYSLEWDRGNTDYDQAQQFFKEAQSALQSSAADVGALFEDSYNLESLISLLAEIDVLYPNKNPDEKLAEKVGKYLPLVKDTKNIVFSENDSLVKKTQWTPFLKFSSRFYASYLYYRYFVQNENYGGNQFLNAFKTLTDQILTVTKDIVLAKKNQIISVPEVQLIAQRLVELNVLPEGLTADSVEKLVRVVLNRILWPAELRLKGSVPNGITPTTLDNVRNEFQIWYETEAFGFSVSANPLKPADLQSALAKKLKDSKITPALKTGLTELSLLAGGPVAQTVDADGHQIVSNIVKVAYDRKSISQLNLKRTLGRVMIRAATESKARLDRYEGVSLPEAQAVFSQVRPVCVEMKILEPDNTTFMDARFRDANIFTAHGNGDTYVNFPEMGDIIGMILSGVTVNSLFSKDIEQKCLPPGTVVDLKTRVPVKCLYGVYLDHMPDYLKATPEFLKFYKSKNRDEFADLFVNILKAAGYVPNEQNMIKLSDASLTPHVIQYVEMVMSRFDADHNARITTSESIKAFPAFKGILTELTKDQSLIKQKDLLALFTYILHYGQPPANVKDFLFRWLPWKANPDKWNVSADREQLVGILGYIADQVSKAEKSVISKEQESEIRRNPDYHEDKDTEDHTQQWMEMYGH
jgi:hypothetical protein